MAENNLPLDRSPDDTARVDVGGWISGPCDAADAGPDQLGAALAAARELLASTVEAVNPGTSRRDLLTYVTQYRKHLADLAAACSGGWISGQSASVEDACAAEVTEDDRLVLDGGRVAVVTSVRHGLFWLPDGHGQGVKIDWAEPGGTKSGTLIRPPGNMLRRVTGGAR
jgi:hypothetical protein